MENSYQKYGKEYYENNKEYFRNYYKIYDENLVRNAVYLLKTEDNKVMYVGATSKLYRRINNHMNCNTDIRLTKKMFKELNLHWEYAYADSVNSREELLYVESYLIYKYGQVYELLNEREPYKNKFKKMDELVKVYLEDMAESLEWKIYNI